MSGRVLQQLLTSGEYDEFDDIIMAEGEFVEFEVTGPALRQVILGVTPFNLLKATRNISDYGKDPDVYYNTDFDPYLEGLEIASVVPLCLLELSCYEKDHEIAINLDGDVRYYLLCNSAFNDHYQDTWYSWTERVEYIQRDPYRYIRGMLDEYNIPYPEHYMKLELNDVLTRSANGSDTKIKRVAFADIDDTEDFVDKMSWKGSKKQPKGEKGVTNDTVHGKAHNKGDKKTRGKKKSLFSFLKRKH